MNYTIFAYCVKIRKPIYSSCDPHAALLFTRMQLAPVTNSRKKRTGTINMSPALHNLTDIIQNSKIKDQSFR